MNECSSLIREPLINEFDEGVQIDEHQGDCRVIMPLRRVDGDPIILYVIENSDGTYTISDEGQTHGMLLTSGVNIDTESRGDRVEAAKMRFDLERADTEIRAKATVDTLGSRILDVFQAATWISFLVYTRSPYSPSYFRDKVASFIRSNNLEFDEDVPVEGESETWEVDFEILNQPQPTYIESIQARDGSDLRRKSKDTSLKWIKIKRADENSRFITMVDDEDGVCQKSKMRTLLDDSDAVIPWENREDLMAAISG